MDLLSNLLISTIGGVMLSISGVTPRAGAFENMPVLSIPYLSTTEKQNETTKTDRVTETGTETYTNTRTSEEITTKPTPKEPIQ